jgi:hypothetical protein
MHPFVRAVLGLWFCIIVAGLIFELVVALRGANFDAAPPMVLLLMLLFGFGLVRFGRWVARDEQGLLLDFVKATLKARDAADLPPP